MTTSNTVFDFSSIGSIDNFVKFIDENKTSTFKFLELNGKDYTDSEIIFMLENVPLKNGAKGVKINILYNRTLHDFPFPSGSVLDVVLFGIRQPKFCYSAFNIDYISCKKPRIFSSPDIAKALTTDIEQLNKPAFKNFFGLRKTDPYDFYEELDLQFLNDIYISDNKIIKRLYDFIKIFDTARYNTLYHHQQLVLDADDEFVKFEKHPHSKIREFQLNIDTFCNTPKLSNKELGEMIFTPILEAVKLAKTNQYLISANSNNQLLNEYLVANNNPAHKISSFAQESEELLDELTDVSFDLENEKNDKVLQMKKILEMKNHAN